VPSRPALLIDRVAGAPISHRISLSRSSSIASPSCPTQRVLITCRRTSTRGR
jgi:hypothetical protein